jgi:type IV pilus assembly protein PilE
MNTQRAFTMIEIIVSLIILGILATIALPNYQRSMRRSQARDAANNLLAIQAAQTVYKEIHGNYCTTDCPALSVSNNDLNTELEINIIRSGGVISYDCSNTVGVNTCRAVLPGIINLDLKLDEAINQSKGVVYCEPTALQPRPNPCCQGGMAGKACP